MAICDVSSRAARKALQCLMGMQVAYSASTAECDWKKLFRMHRKWSSFAAVAIPHCGLGRGKANNKNLGRIAPIGARV